MYLRGPKCNRINLPSYKSFYLNKAFFSTCQKLAEDGLFNYFYNVKISTQNYCMFQIKLALTIIVCLGTSGCAKNDCTSTPGTIIF